jgi:predicted RNA-binding Zn ribbon-like protein
VQCYPPEPHLSRAEYWCYTSDMPHPTESLSFAPHLPFKYVGGDPSIDLVNTVDWTSRGPEQDRLTNYQRLVEWAQGAEILPQKAAAALRARAKAHPRAAGVAQKAALQARAVLWQVFSSLATSQSAGDALGEFNRLLAEALEHLRVLPTGEKRRRDQSLELRWDQLGESLESVLWPVIWSAASLLVSEESGQIRICGGPDCGWMYVDRSRNGLRRWCQMETCGTREKTRRRYHRT